MFMESEPGRFTYSPQGSTEKTRRVDGTLGTHGVVFGAPTTWRFCRPPPYGRLGGGRASPLQERRHQTVLRLRRTE